MKNFAEKLKTDKKMRTTVISTCVGAVIVIATAIVVPVTLHNRPSVEQDAAQVAISNELSAEEDTTVATEPETEEITAETTEPITDVPTTQATNNGSSINKGSTSDTGKNGSSGTNAGTSSSTVGSSSQMPVVIDNGGQNNDTPTVPSQSDEHIWTQAEVDALVAEIKAYAQSKGFTINPSLTTQGTSWSNPVHTGTNKDKTKSDLKYDIDFVYTLCVQDFGYFPSGAELNVIAKPCAANEWEIYVVY